ncbi:cation-transporting P-type ATPase [Pseudovibrio sp. SPO723]|uniref:cation-transporting P-type ATPase n=1 Tax=Nesiotobacter zosterae TaxID=392721 RepID=UPI0029C1AD12|nr:cation-transporting P-type ATPase [Pseudovibrio sp. SPO723]MDX5594634.1 cation-transporting P-type ATPase [Pseudovibrio sp. SPO723]
MTEAPRWHALSISDTLLALSATEKGLTQLQVEKRLQEHGPNKLPENAGPSALKRFLGQFHNVLIYVLLGSACITALLGHVIDTSVILAVVIINAIIGFIQEGNAERAMDAIRQMLAPSANVIRDEQRKSIPADRLVPGDIVLLEAGDRVPADLRLTSATRLQVQEAILTGESLPTEKSTAPAGAETSLGDRSSLVFSGTLITKGQATGVVVATGAATEIGRISGLLSNVEQLTTPLLQHMAAFAKWLTFLILLIALLLLGYGALFTSLGFKEVFMAVVGLSVAAIPEGLPAVLTITLAVGVKAMAEKNAIVRRLPAIETLGSVSVICTDKTGTLTRNEMMVASAVTSHQAYMVEGDGYTPVGAVLKEDGMAVPAPSLCLQALARTAALCNDASLHRDGAGWAVVGDPMEGALLTFAEKLEIRPSHEQHEWPRTGVIPFDAEHRYMASLNRSMAEGLRIFVKGAPEKLLALSFAQLSEAGHEEPLNTAYWLNEVERIAARGQRVLAFAIREEHKEGEPLDENELNGTLTFVGLVGLIDPPRPEALQAISECHSAGIRLKMITGDHAKTAVAIGRQIGLTSSDLVLTGADLDKINDADLKARVQDCDVFARTSPEHKLRLVMALQSLGMTVAMTGDGVNDAPALKRADAGVAMGQKGSEAAKEAAEIVLADDNFATIVAAVRQGRTVYDNIKKVISWTLPTNAGEAMTIIVALLLGLALPVTPVQILWINMITAATLGLALAFEPTETHTMKRPPRPRSEPLLTSGLIWHIVFVAMLFIAGVFGIYAYAISSGYPVELARTLSMNTLVIMEIFHLFFIRRFYSVSLDLSALVATPIVWITVTITVSAQIAITYLPALQGIFDTRAMSLGDCLLVLSIGIALFVLVETEKHLRRRLFKADQM